VVGAYLVTGALLVALGLTGVVGRIMAAIPMPVVMGMVAGVFMQFGIDWLLAFKQAIWIALPMTVVFAVLLAAPRLARTIPPLIAALVVGLVAAHLTDAYQPASGPPLAWTLPNVLRPSFTWAAMAELVVPLAVTVLAAQNAQGFAILQQSGHTPPVDNVTTACGAGSLVSAWFGSVPTCLAGPVTAILVAGTPREKHYASGIIMGGLAVLFGLTAPLVARLSILAPRPLIAALAGLAMLKVLQASFTAAFKGPHSFGALISFLVTFAGIPILNIGSPFWGLVFGYLAARVYDEKP
jgi:benzoate membrane transport protein